MLMKYRLFTPGPTSVPEATLLELARPVHHHRTAEFRATFNELQTLLRYVFQTQHNVYTITGSGTAAFEAGFTSCVAPGMRVLNVTNGKFAERWASYAKTYSCPLTEITLPYGQHVTPDLMRGRAGEGPRRRRRAGPQRDEHGHRGRPGGRRQGRAGGGRGRHAADRGRDHEHRGDAVQDGRVGRGRGDHRQPEGDDAPAGAGVRGVERPGVAEGVGREARRLLLRPDEVPQKHRRRGHAVHAGPTRWSGPRWSASK